MCKCVKTSIRGIKMSPNKTFMEDGNKNLSLQQNFYKIYKPVCEILKTILITKLP